MKRLGRARAPCQWGPGGRIGLVILSLLPLLLGGVFLAFIVVILFVHDPRDGESPLFGYLPFIWGATIPVGLAAFAAYLFDLFRNPRVPADQRPIWILLFVMVSMFAQPVYWGLYLRPGLETVPPT